MQKERVRSLKLRKLRNFEILVRNRRKKSGRKEMFITQSILNILSSNFLQTSSFFQYQTICVNFSRPIFKKSQYFRRAEKVVPPKKISIFLVPKSSQYIFRKSQPISGVCY